MKGAIRAFILSVSLLFFPIPNASAQDGNTTIQVAYTEWFPYTYTENGQAKGFEIETTRAVLARMGFRPEFSAYPWKRCLANLENGKSALVVSLLKTREREEYTVYPEEHISVSRTVFAARKDHVPDYAGDLASLRGMRVGVIMGFSYGPALDRVEFLEKDPAVDTASLIGKLIAGRDGLIAENQVVLKAQARRMGVLDQMVFLAPPIHRQRLYVGFSRARGLEGMAREFSRFLKSFKQSGDYQDLLASYGLEIEEMTDPQAGDTP